MQDYPHIYRASAQTVSGKNVTIGSPGLPDLESSSPPEFGGPEGYWSPETLLVASVVDCFVLTFRAIARGSKMEWSSLECSATGTLDKEERVTRFTEFRIQADLAVPAGTRVEKAERLLEMAEKHCLITNSLSASVHLEARVTEQG